MQILLIRHGESEADILNVHEGRADFPLTNKGRNQVHRMANRVKDEFPPEVIWASTLRRASETATILAETVGCSLILKEELMEFNNGIQAGLSFEEAKNIPIPYHMHERFEGGESHIEFRMRVEAIFSNIVTSSTQKRIAIVAHGGVINCLLRSFFNMPVSREFYFINGDTAMSCVEIKKDTKVIHFLNSTSHLA